MPWLATYEIYTEMSSLYKQSTINLISVS